jgi:hypothetical protein
LVSTKRILNRLKKKETYEPKSEIGTDMFLPNHSGSESYLEKKDVTFKNLTVTDNTKLEGELQGGRVWITAGSSRNSIITPGSLRFMTVDSTYLSATKGIVAPRNGSIVGASIVFDCQLIEPGVGPAITFSVATNTPSEFTKDYDIAGVANNLTDYHTQARGIDTFNAGDMISLYIENSGNVDLYLNDIIMTVELQFDT